MSKLQELQEKRNKLATEIRTLGDAFNENGKKWKDEEQRQSWERVNKDYDETVSAMTEARNISDIEQRLNDLRDAENDPPRGTRRTIPGRDGDDPPRTRRERPQVDEEQRCLAMAGWCRSQLGYPLRKSEARACKTVGLHPGAKQLRLHLPGTNQYRDVAREFRSHHLSRAVDKTIESRAMSAYTLGKGGILAPDSFVRSLEVNMLAFGGIRQVAEMLVTSGGEEMTWPTVDDTSNEGERLGESKPIGASVEPTFGAVTWNAYKYSSKPILVPYELLEDSIFDIPTLLGELMGERVGRKTSKDFTTGTGAAGPRGIMTAASVGKTTNSGTAITADEIFDLIHSIDPTYRTGAGFMLHDAVLLYLRKLKDGEGRYIWQNGMHEGVPDRLLGYPVTISQEMDSTVASSKKTMLFGQLSKYKIRRVNQARLYRLEERYRDNDQDGFILMVREDGNLLTAGTPPVKYMLQA